MEAIGDQTCSTVEEEEKTDNGNISLTMNNNAEMLQTFNVCKISADLPVLAESAKIREEQLAVESFSSQSELLSIEVINEEKFSTESESVKNGHLLTEPVSVESICEQHKLNHIQLAILQNKLSVTESLSLQNKSFKDDTLSSKINEVTEYPDFTRHPLQVTGAWTEFGEAKENFTKGCKWSPDGSCLLTNSNDNCLRIFNLPEKLWQNTFDWETVEELLAALTIRESELIYDYCWYPPMSSYDPVTCCLVTASRDHPVHMWDAFTGQLRCTYRPYSTMDEIVSPHSLAIDFFGEKLFCGFKKIIRIFDISRPGRDCIQQPTSGKRDGQVGIISCIAFSPSNKELYAAGSYCRTVGIYSLKQKKSLFLLSGQLGGVTHIIFSSDGTKLYSGGRKDPKILCWDIRNSRKILFSMRRVVKTNQRMYFDIDSTGQYLISGNENGVVTAWDLSKPPRDMPNSQEPILEPVLFFHAHNDCVNGISIHPSLPLLLTSSGQRHFAEPLDSEDSETEIQNMEHQCDNSVRLWWTGRNQCVNSNVLIS